MLEKDNSYQMVDSEVESLKRQCSLKPEGQMQERGSGHSSGDYGGGPPQSAAVPGGNPGTMGGGKKSY